MAVTVAQLAAYLGIEARDADQTSELQMLLDVSTALIEADAPGAPVPVKNLAIMRHAAYQHDQPYAARSMSFANAMINSGAGSLLSRWVLRRLAGVGVVAAATIETSTPVAITYTGYAGWLASGSTEAVDADFAAGIAFENGTWTQPSGGPGHIFFGVPVSIGYPGDITAYLEPGHGGAFSQQTDVVTYLGNAYIVGVSEHEILATAAGTEWGLVYA